MATFDEIGVLVSGEVENVDLATNIFSFGTIRFGAKDITVSRGEKLVDLVTGLEANTTYHKHDSQYFTETELSSQTATPGADLIGLDLTYSWQTLSLTAPNGFVEEAIQQIDSALANISTEFDETLFRITQNGDATAKLAFDVSAISTGTVRNIIMPDLDINLGNITTTDYVDNAVSLAISGLSAKPACQLATRAQDWVASPSIDFFGIKTNQTVDGLLDGQWFIITQSSLQGTGTYAFWFSEGTTTVPPVTGTLQTVKIDVNTTDTQEVAFGKMVVELQGSNLVNDYDIFPFPTGQAAIGDVQLVNKFDGLTPNIQVSNTFTIAVNKVDSYTFDVDNTRGFNGVGYSLLGNTLTITNMRENFLANAPILDGEFNVEVGYRILIKDMPSIDDRFNGIWEVTGVPSTTSMELERPADSDGLSGFPEIAINSEVVEGNYTFITQGDQNGSRGFILITPGLITVNGSSQDWTQFISIQQVQPNFDTFVYPFVQVDGYQRINIGPLTQGQMIAGSDRNDPAPVNTLSALSDIFCNIDSDGVGGLEIKDDRIVDSMVKTGTILEESITFFTSTDISAAEAETLTTGADADLLHHHHTTNIIEGTNLYFTEGRVRATLLTGLNTGLTGDIVATDSILQAFGKVQNAITNNLEPNKLNVEMDNLSNVAINTSLLPATNNSIDLGSASLKFKDGYFAGKLTVDGGIDPIYLQFSGLANDTLVLDGALWAENNAAATLKYKDGLGSSDDIVIKTLSQTLENKTMDFSATGNNSVTITTLEVAEGTNLYFTDARAKAAAVANSITDGVTDVAPSQNIVFDELALKADDADVLKKDGSVALQANLSAGNFQIKNILAGTDANDAVTKTQLDSLAAGLALKAACRVATHSELIGVASGSKIGKTFTTTSTALSENDIDDITIQVGDRVLVKHQGDGVGSAVDNGIYTVTTLADGASQGLVLTRATDADGNPSGEVSFGNHTFVQEGTEHEFTGWALYGGVGAIDVDVDSQNYTQFQGLPSYAGGDGIAFAGDIVSVDLATNPGLEFSSTQLQVKIKAVSGMVRDADGLSVNLGDFSTSDLSEGTNEYWTQTRFDNALTAKDTDDLTEGASNFYYTEARFDTSLSGKDTDDLTEGASNFYYTEARFDTSLSGKTTADLAEDISALYYTDERVDDRVSALISDGTGITWSYNDPAGTLTGDVSLTSFDTDNLTEGASNFYYTEARFDTSLAAASTNDLSEGGANLYYTQARFDTAFGLKDTDDLSEGTGNLYFTELRVRDTVLNSFVASSGAISNLDTVEEAFEKLEGQKEIWAHGSTPSRPGSPATGQRYLDTQIGKPIWYDGANWIDATGTTV